MGYNEVSCGTISTTTRRGVVNIAGIEDAGIAPIIKDIVICAYCGSIKHTTKRCTSCGANLNM